MITCIDLRNFKCFDKLHLKCTELNLLCGLNGMGKSSVIQALLVLRQSFESHELLNGNLILGGQRIDIGTGTDVLYEDADGDSVTMSLESDNVSNGWTLTFECVGNSDELSPSATKETWETYVDDEWQSIPPFGGRALYVNAERVGPRKWYPTSEILARRVEFGVASEHAWNFFSHNEDYLMMPSDPRCHNPRRRQLRQVLDDWLQYVSPGAHLNLDRVASADAVVPGFTFDRPSDVPSRNYRATNVGFGLSYVMPVLLALLSPPGTLCLIENPESHLHPHGQTKLAELAARAAKAGLQVFAETHSDHFMDGIRIAVKEGIIAPEQTSFHYFEREGNRSIVTSPDVDKDGRLSKWPTGFFDQHTENMMKLLGPRR